MSPPSAQKMSPNPWGRERISPFRYAIYSNKSCTDLVLMEISICPMEAKYQEARSEVPHPVHVQADPIRLRIVPVRKITFNRDSSPSCIYLGKKGGLTGRNQLSLAKFLCSHTLNLLSQIRGPRTPGGQVGRHRKESVSARPKSPI